MCPLSFLLPVSQTSPESRVRACSGVKYHIHTCNTEKKLIIKNGKKMREKHKDERKIGAPRRLFGCIEQAVLVLTALVLPALTALSLDKLQYCNWTMVLKPSLMSPQSFRSSIVLKPFPKSPQSYQYCKASPRSPQSCRWSLWLAVLMIPAHMQAHTNTFTCMWKMILSIHLWLQESIANAGKTAENSKGGKGWKRMQRMMVTAV